jgi:hypothetical protein
MGVDRAFGTGTRGRWAARVRRARA